MGNFKMHSKNNPTIIFDIDGTLADNTHRQAFVSSTPKNWAKFNSLIAKDTPKYPIVELYRTLWGSNKYKITLISGREEKLRTETEEWLRKNNIEFNSLLMRKTRDYRQDAIVKEEILLKLLANGENILFVVDDRKQVVDMWRKHGITCLQCAEGNF